MRFIITKIILNANRAYSLVRHGIIRIRRMIFAEGYILLNILTKLGSYPGRDKISLHSTTSRPALGPTQPPIQ
jgi:hypothetical protein